MKRIYLITFLALFSLLVFGQKSNTYYKTEQKMETTKKMQVEVWSDIMCPFCYIGKRHYEKALEQFANKNDVEIVWKSFQLDPNIPTHFEKKVNVYEYLAERKGISREQSEQMHNNVVQMAKNAGLDYDFDKVIIANSFNVHRLIQFAKTKGLGDEAKERLFLAYFTQGKDLSNTSILMELGKEIGLTEGEVNEALTNDDYAYKVKQDIQEAESVGVRGVPFFVFNRRYAVSGAQPAEAFLETLEKSFSEWRKANPEIKLQVSEGAACTPQGDCK